MKWLYRILRLFKCPHKDARIGDFKRIDHETQVVVKHQLVLQCTRCGRVKKV